MINFPISNYDLGKYWTRNEHINDHNIVAWAMGSFDCIDKWWFRTRDVWKRLDWLSFFRWDELFSEAFLIGVHDDWQEIHIYIGNKAISLVMADLEED